MNVPGADMAAAGAAGAAVLTGAWRAARPQRPAQARLALYLERARAQLGAAPAAGRAPLAAAEVLRRTLGPLGAVPLGALARALGFSSDEQLELRLRRAGMGCSCAAYRKSCLYWVAGAPVGLGTLGLSTGSAGLVSLFFVAGLVVGLRRGPERLARGTRRRNDKVRNDLPTVACALALRVDNNKTLPVALSDLLPRGDGPVVEDLARALHLMDMGYGETSAYELLATEAGDPAASRFYRFLAVASTGGVDLAPALLEQADDLRRQRREEVERSAARRQMVLVLPNMVFMAPVLFAFILAPLPRLLFGR